MMNIPYNNSLSATGAANLSAPSGNIGEALQSSMRNMGGSPIINKAMGEATSQIASAVAQEMVNAVTQTAMRYTGQTSFGQSGMAGSGAYGQRASNMADQMRSSILGGQLPTRSLMPIAGRGFAR